MSDEPTQSPQIAPQTAAPAGRKGLKRWLTWLGLGVANLSIMCIGALYAVLAYQLFSTLFSNRMAGQSGLMLWAFLAGVPFSTGLLVTHLAGKRVGTHPKHAAMLTMGATALYVFTAGALLREGMICVVMAAPLLLAFALLGWLVTEVAMIALTADWRVWKRKRDQAPRMLLGVALIAPLLLAPLEAAMQPATHQASVSASTFIEAPPDVIWQHINWPRHIRPDELGARWSHAVGFPRPVDARTVTPALGGERELRWERGIHFGAVITEWQPGKHIAWRYHFAPDSFPPGALDKHIVVGGRYFTLNSSRYTLTPEGAGTRLQVDMAYSITTTFNGYAGWWARRFAGDTANAVLQLYKTRAERTQSQAQP
jgi:hypothetical protein